MNGLRRVLTPYEQGLCDRAWCARTGLDSVTLMETAANAVLRTAQKLLKQKDDRVLIVLGWGNNAGDGWALGRLLMAQGYPVDFLDVTPEKDPTPDTRRMKDAALALGANLVTREIFADPPRYALVVDALFGSGFKATRPFGDELIAITDGIRALRTAGSKVLAIDIPSGLDGTTGQADPAAVRADLTVSFLSEKQGLVTDRGRALGGDIILDPIGMPKLFQEEALREEMPRAYVTTPDFLLAHPIQTRDLDFKGSNLKLQITGGADGMPGAAYLASLAALRGGSTYTYLAAEDAHLSQAIQNLPEVIMKDLATIDWDTQLREVPVHVVGPGLGRAMDPAILKRILQQAQHLVLDADALNLLAAMSDGKELLRQRADRGLAPAILTPHIGEFRRLFPDLATGVAHEAARAAAQATGAVVVYKGHATVIADPSGTIVFNNSGNAGLGKAGSGDVQTGLIGALVARKVPTFEAAILGTYVHGLAGDLLKDEQGTIAYRIQELPDAIARVFQSAN